MTNPEIAAASARAKLARAELQATLRALQTRLAPSSLASEAIGGIKRRSEDMADDAVEAVRRRPIVASAAAAGLGALIGARLLRARRKDTNGEPA